MGYVSLKSEELFRRNDGCVSVRANGCVEHITNLDRAAFCQFCMSVCRDAFVRVEIDFAFYDVAYEKEWNPRFLPRRRLMGSVGDASAKSLQFTYW